MVVEGDGFEPSKSKTADLQSAPFGRSGTLPKAEVETGGAGDGTRTRNLLITNQLLCQLSYTSKIMVPQDRIELSTQGFSVPCSTD
jgi:hypothetical protein